MGFRDFSDQVSMLYERELSSLKGFAHSRVPDTYDPTDTVQDAFVDILEQGSLEGIKSPGGHAMTIVHRRAMDEIRKKYRNKEILTDPNGNVKRHVTGNGMPTSFRYDEADRLTSKIVDDNTVATDGVFHCTNASWTAITYDDDDNRISEDAFQAQLNTTGCPGTAQKSGKGTYSYDRLGRITHGQAPFDTKTIPYVYDDAGNVVSETGFAYTYQNNRLLSRQALPGGLTTFAYDHFGNQNAETTAGQTTNTSYDAASHARRTTSPDGSWVEYAYDGLGRQVRRHTSTGEVTLFFRDQFSDDIALETNATGGPTARYVLDATGEPVANEKSDNSWQRGYYVSDPRGNLTMITRTYEDVVQAVFGYDPFGKEKPAETSKIGNWDSRLRFQMAPQDPKTKTYSIGPRIFNPDIYRFVGADNFVAAASNLDLQIDPLTGNRYLYAGSNPANMIDDGHAPKWVKKLVNKVYRNRHKIIDFGVTIAAGAGVAACIASVACGVAGGALIVTNVAVAGTTAHVLAEKRSGRNDPKFVGETLGNVGVAAGKGIICAGAFRRGCLTGILLGGKPGSPTYRGTP